MPHKLRVLIQRSNDATADLRRLERVYDLLRKYPGADRCTLAIVGNGKEVHLDFPDTRTRVCPDLEQAIQQLLGYGSVQVIPEPL